MRPARPRAAALSRAQSSAGDADIGADAEGRRQLADEREQERARAGAEIRHPQRARARAAAVERRQRRLDQGFGLRPRHQCLAVEPQRQAPEFLAAEDARDRFVPQPACRQGGDRARLVGGEPRRPLARRGRRDRGRARGRGGAARRAPACRGRRGETRAPAGGARRRPRHPARDAAVTVVTPHLPPPAAPPGARSPARR